MSDDETTATAPHDEPKAEAPAADPHPHGHEAPAAPAHTEEAGVPAPVAPEAEAGVEAVTEPDPEHAPEPTPAPPPELAEVAAFTGESPASDVAEHAEPTDAPKSEADEESAKPAKRTKKAPKAAADPTEESEPAEASEPAAEPTEVPAEPKPENKKKWYAIKVQSGREDTIKAAILRKVAIEGLEDVFGQIMIPYEEEIVKKTVRVKDKKSGEYTTQEKKVTRKKKKFQGYLFAELEFNDRILYLFRETSGVGDFLNLRGTPPVPEPMPEHEVQSMLTGEVVRDPSKKGGKVKVKLDFEKGDRIRIRDGSFANQEGEVKAISEPKDPTDTPKVTVVLTFWGRPLEVELDYWQVEKA